MQLKHSEPEEPVLVYGDCDRIRQVFLNIIDNACKYGSEGEKLDVTLSPENDMAVVRFRDYGVGIPQEELPMVKNKFYKGSAKGKGTGIGLALCDEIVAMHKGRFEIDSTYGEGTTVVVRLPLLNKENQK
jgi:signal transduction histidine kinase